MTDQKKPDAKEINASFNQSIRDQRASRRVNWQPSSSPDRDVQHADRDDLNQAIRHASGRGEQEPGEEPQSYPWKSISTLEDES